MRFTTNLHGHTFNHFKQTHFVPTYITEQIINSSVIKLFNEV